MHMNRPGGLHLFQEETMSVFSNILCCINLSEYPDDVAQYVNDIIKQNSAALTVMRVAPCSQEVVRRSASLEFGTLVKEHQQQNNDVFIKYVKEHFDGEPNIVLAEGNVEDEVLRVIDKYCADLVIIGSMSTKGLFGRWLNRSSESIIGKTRVPVLVIPNELSLECTPNF